MKLLMCVLFCLSTAYAAVNPYHAMNVFKGTYKLYINGEMAHLEILRDGSVKLLNESNYFYFASSAVNSLGNTIGPSGLSVMTIMLSGGSDEQTITYHARIVPTQIDELTQPKLLDVLYVENDGPNNTTSYSLFNQNKIQLYKYLENSKGKYKYQKL